MKKKIISLLTVGAILGGTVTYAGTNYYADLLFVQKDHMERELTVYYEELMQTKGEQQHRDMVHYVTIEREALMDKLERYVQEKVYEEAEKRRESHVKAIDEAIQTIEVELQSKIDELIDIE